MTRENPCLSCGACCAFFRVSFYWGETTESPDGIVPAELTEDITPFCRAMKGSNQKNPRCFALEGNVGESVHCKIYAQRSSTCREFGFNFIDAQVIIRSEEYERCTQARAHWNLPPLSIDTLPAQKTTAEQTPHWPVTPTRKSRKKRRTPQRSPEQSPIFSPPQ